MVKEPDDSAKDDPLEEIDLEEIDLDALLEEVGDADDAKDKKETTEILSDDASSEKDDDILADPFGIDDDAIVDLDAPAPAADEPMEDTAADEIDAILEDDLLSADELTEIVDVGGEAAEESDDATDILDVGTPADGAAADDDITDLLDGLDDAPAEDIGDDVLDADDLIEDEPPAEEVAEVEAPAEKPAKKGGKKSFAPRGKKGSRGRVGAKKSRAKPDKSRKVKAPKPVSSGKVLHFVCSECYTTISLPVSYSQEQVTCPECFHVGKKPDESFLNTVGMHKSGERSSILITTLVGVLMVVALFAVVYLRTPYGAASFPDMQGDDLSTWTMALLGGGGLLTIIFLVLLWRSENNRWEAYF